MMSIRWRIAVACLAVWLGGIAPGAREAFADDTRPNFLIIIADDQRFDNDMYEYMPNMWSNIVVDRGTWFPNAYVTTALCCPSRSSIFTGMYTSSHGVVNNSTALNVTTFAQHLRNSNYYTGLFGKYLNSQSGAKRAEFDQWVAFEWGAVADYRNFWLNVYGDWKHYCPTCNQSGYSMSVITNKAKLFLDDAKTVRTLQHGRPFLMIYAPNGPHEPSEPASADAGANVNSYVDDDFAAPSVNEDTTDKPYWLQSTFPALTSTQLSNIQANAKDQVRTLKSLDREIGELLTKLQNIGQMDNTVIIYISDNGLFWGEHRAKRKRLVYEEAVHVPFAMRYPPLTQNAPDVIYDLVANIDIAPTIYDLAGIPMPAGVQGLPLRRLITRSAPWRDHIFIEAWPSSDTAGLTVPAVPFTAVHTGRYRHLGPQFGYVYVENQGDRTEFYDLAGDPFQLNNMAGHPAYAGPQETLRKMLHPCHVLTAAFGNPNAGPIQVLWQAHQRLIGKHWNAPWHRAYMAGYDQVGPRLAAHVARTPWLRAAIRWAARAAAYMVAGGPS